jgi:hypothetical protein
MVVNIMVYFLFVTMANALLNVKFGKMLHDETLRMLFDLTIRECWSNCEQRASCKSINYDRIMRVCYLNSWNMSSEASSEVTIRIGVISREKTNKVIYTLFYVISIT